jgi:1,4-dihydroxy-2-naphthoyl-CoA hydrolase
MDKVTALGKGLAMNNIPSEPTAGRATESVIWFGGRLPSVDVLNAAQGDTLHHHLGIELVAVGDDFLTMRMPVDGRTRQPKGRLHGGASVALAETVGSLAASCCVDPAVSAVVGLEINANHVRPAREGWVFGTARPEALGRTVHVWSIRIEDEAGKLVCISRLTIAVIPLERG